MEILWQKTLSIIHYQFYIENESTILSDCLIF